MPSDGLLEPWQQMAIAEAQEDKRLRRFPRCRISEEPITDYDAVCIDGQFICDSCLDDLRVLIEEEYE